MTSASARPRERRPFLQARTVGSRAGALLASGAVILTGCGGGTPARVTGLGGQRAADTLVSFASCGDALRNLRAAASRAASSYGPALGEGTAGADPRPAAAQPGIAAPGGGQPAPGSYSGTNTATPGVDEPDLVKTDGQRIVTVIGSVLRVVDAQTRQLTGTLDLSAVDGLASAVPASLLLAGTHALILFGQGYPVAGPAAVRQPITGPSLLLIDVSAGLPRILSEYTIDGSLVDARQVGSIARVIIHSTPRLAFPPGGQGSTQQQAASYQAAISHAPLSSWLPRYEVTDGGTRHTGLVDCAATSHPAAATYTGTSMLTVLTFDLSAGALTDGQPLTIVADGDTAYSDGATLYVASDRQRGVPPVYPAASAQPATPSSPAPLPERPRQYVTLYKFDISGSGRPVYQASGTVPGWLLGSSGTAQYALSEWQGALRVATTTGLFGWSGPPPRSAVYVLDQEGSRLVIVGKVGGLGQGEQIYAVRFAGPAGYVVTYRSVDPLYTLDLSDPAHPRVAGVLLLRGYSAYLDPVDAAHLIGIGQATDARGHIQGTQISLFDVSDIAAPARLAVSRLWSSRSEAEVDPHAVLYWPATELLVIPVRRPAAGTPQRPPDATPSPAAEGTAPPTVSAAVALQVGDHTISRLGTITDPVVPGYPRSGQIRRSLVIGSTLWTLSDTGLLASSLTTLTPLAWVPFG